MLTLMFVLRMMMMPTTTKQLRERRKMLDVSIDFKSLSPSLHLSHNGSLHYPALPSSFVYTTHLAMLWNTYINTYTHTVNLARSVSPRPDSFPDTIPSLRHRLCGLLLTIYIYIRTPSTCRLSPSLHPRLFPCVVDVCKTTKQNPRHCNRWLTSNSLRTHTHRIRVVRMAVSGVGSLR
jgi:hypothetical protein